MPRKKLDTGKKETRSVHVSMRFTESEMVKLRGLMEDAGYKSRTRFIRDSVLRKELYVVQRKELTNPELRRRINALIAAIEKIGVNYNQTVKQYNAVMKMRTAKGEPIVSTQYTRRYMDRLFEKTQKLEALVQEMIDTTERYTTSTREEQKCR